jgi:hypothetical protein
MKFDEGVRRRRAGDEKLFSPCRGKSRATARNIAVTGDLASGSREGAKTASEIRLILNSGLDGDTIGVIKPAADNFRRPVLPTPADRTRELSDRNAEQNEQS